MPSAIPVVMAMTAQTSGAPAPLELFQRALDGFGARVHAVHPDQWHGATPCTEWDVRDLVGHLVGEAQWAAPLLEGATLEAAATRIPEDPAGADPVQAWDAAADAVRAELHEAGLLERTVHLSYGDVPAQRYVEELTCDLAVHSWDLARAAGLDERIDSQVVDAAWDYVTEHAVELTGSGLYGEPLDVPADADTQTRLLAATGRRL